MTPLQVSALNRAACRRDGTSLYYERDSSKRQLDWLLARKLVRIKGSRVIATRDGKKILAHQTF